MMRSTIPVLQLAPLHAFYWHADAPRCELYAADLQQLENLRTVDFTAARLPAEAAMTSLWSEIAQIKTEGARSLRGYGYWLLFDGQTGQVIGRSVALDPWVLVAARFRVEARLRRVA